MSLFPDRSPVRITSRELAIPASLTEAQKDQINSVTKRYLGDSKLVGYENTLAVMPVVKHIITSGLKDAHDRENILPTDNLDVSFKRGYKTRNSLLKQVRDATYDLSEDARFEGPLALPKDLVINAKKETSRSTFLAELPVGNEVKKVVDVRQPIFDQIVKFCRDKIEEDIPSSKEVKLTIEQESGLVRHLVFSWFALGIPRVLLETQDFMANKQPYLEEVKKADQDSFAELARFLGLDSDDAATYLRDVAYQTEDLVKKIPEKPSEETDYFEVAVAVNNAFVNLENYFLLVNPFTRTLPFSENPNDKGRSIWDEKRTTAVVINGVRYLVPKLETLELAFQLSRAINPERSLEFKSGITSINTLLKELADRRHDRTIPILKKEQNSLQQSLEKARSLILAGGAPSEIAIPAIEVREMVKGQATLMTDEIQFFPAVWRLHLKTFNTALEILRTYRGGMPARAGDIEPLLSLRYTPGVLREATYDFVRRAIVNRIGTFEELYAHEDLVSSIFARTSTGSLREQFPKAIDTTVLDLLDFRHRAFLQQLRDPQLPIAGEKMAAVWRAILAQEKSRLEVLILGSLGSVPSIDRERMAKKHPLSRKLAYLNKLDFALDSGKIPSDVSIILGYREEWLKAQQVRFVNARNQWTKTSSVTHPLVSNFYEDGSLIRDFSDPEGLRKRLLTRDVPAEVALGAIISLAPPELWPKYPVSLEDVAHEIYPDDPTDPFSFHFAGRKVSEEKRRKVYEALRTWLATKGINFDSDRFGQLITPAATDEMVKSAHVYHRLFSIQGAVGEWFKNMWKRLEIKTNYRERYFRTSPAEYIKRHEDVLASKEKLIKAYEASAVAKMEKRVQDLKLLGLIRLAEDQ